MSNARGLTYGIALGAGLMFLFDPRRGHARRAVIGQKALRAVHDLEHGAGIGARDFEHRAAGLAARVFNGRPRENVVDDVLVARVRSKLGRVCSHPHAIQVSAVGDGCIELSGPILRGDLDAVLDAVRHVPGVRGIDDDLDVRDQPGDIPSLQGPAPRRNRVPRMGTPATRFILGSAATGLCVLSLIKGQPLGLLIGATTVLALARSIAHRTTPRALVQVQRRAKESQPGEQQPVQGLREAYRDASDWAPKF